MKKVGIMIFILTLVMQGWAQICTKNNVNYFITGNFAVVMKSEKAKGDVVISDKVTFNGREYIVTDIAINAFRDCEDITSVTLPNTIRTIGSGAFWRCTKMTKTNIPNSVVSIGNQAYQQSGLTADHDGLMYVDDWLVGYNFIEIDSPDGSGKKIKKMKRPEGNVVIKEGTKGIAVGTFSLCSQVTSVTIPASVEYLGLPMFQYCKGLSSITIDERNNKYDSRDHCNAIVEKKSNVLLAGCKGTIIPNSVVSIGAHAFEKCESMFVITIPKGVERIGESAFSGCVDLVHFNIPETIVQIQNDAFSKTGWYKEQPDGLLYKDGWLLGYKGRMPEGVLEIKAGTKHIIPNVFAKCDKLEEVKFPDELEEIPPSAFSECTGIKNINLPQGIKSIGYHAFWECSGLKTVSVPDGVTTIDNGAFGRCTHLKSVNIPYSVSTVYLSSFGATAWYDKLSNGPIYLNNWLLGWKGKQPKGKVVIKDGTQHIAPLAFESYREIESVVIPNSVKTIGMYAFSGCTNLTSAIIPEGVENIGALSFQNCKALTEVNIPRSVKSVGLLCFFNTGWQNAQPDDEPLYLDGWLLGPKSPRRIITDNELEIKPGTIGVSVAAFQSYKNLMSVTIPSSIKYVGSSAFLGCTGLVEVKISDLEAWKNIKFADPASDPTFYTKSLMLNGQTITSW